MLFHMTMNVSGSFVGLFQQRLLNCWPLHCPVNSEREGIAKKFIHGYNPWDIKKCANSKETGRLNLKTTHQCDFVLLWVPRICHQIFTIPTLYDVPQVIFKKIFLWYPPVKLIVSLLTKNNIGPWTFLVFTQTNEESKPQVVYTEYYIYMWDIKDMKNCFYKRFKGVNYVYSPPTTTINAKK